MYNSSGNHEIIKESVIIKKRNSVICHFQSLSLLRMSFLSSKRKKLGDTSEKFN